MKQNNRQTLPSWNEVKDQLPYLPRTVKLVWSISRGWTILWSIALLLLGLTPAWLALLTRTVINRISDLSGSGWQNWQPIAVPAVALALVMLAGEAANRLAWWASTNRNELVQEALTLQVQTQALRLDMQYYDSAEYYDMLHRAGSESVSRPLIVMDNLGQLLRYLITFISLAIIIAQYAIWLPFLVVAGALPSFIIVFIQVLKLNRWRIANTSDERRLRYLDWMMTLRNAVMEVRLFNLGETFQKSYIQIRRRLRTERIRILSRSQLGEMAATVLSWAIAALVMVWMVRRTLVGSANLGDLALFYQVLMQAQTLVRNAMKTISELYGNLFYLQNLFEFLALQPVVSAPETAGPIPPERPLAIAFEDVSFAYPQQAEDVLENFNLSIPAGKITAIVGENGAGKSTLIKLLCRFYDPTAGNITINGLDLRLADPQELLKTITVLFQEPVRFHETAATNISYGDLAREMTQHGVQAAALAGGADQFIRDLPQGYQTQMGKWFGGAELSSGQWQRLALSRAFYREAGLVLLDEPTAMMDSWAETDWLKRFRTLAQGKTALVISHRFTTAMQADLIYVMRAGKIVESGTHQELLENNGLYAVSWREQMQDR